MCEQLLLQITILYPLFLWNPLLTLFTCNLSLSPPVSAVRSRCQKLERWKSLNLRSAIGVRPLVVVVLRSVVPAAGVNEGISISSWRETTDYGSMCPQGVNLVPVTGVRPWVMVVPVPGASWSKWESQHQQVERGPRVMGPVCLSMSHWEDQNVYIFPSPGACTCNPLADFKLDCLVSRRPGISVSKFDELRSHAAI